MGVVTMNARIVQLADALVASLAAGEFTFGALTPTRTYALDAGAGAVDQLIVNVCPMGGTDTLRATDGWGEMGIIGVSVIKKIAPGATEQDAITETDQLMLLVEELREHVQRETLRFDSIDADAEEETYGLGFDREQMASRRDFSATIRIVYRME
jgi:hypothetical protein